MRKLWGDLRWFSLCISSRISSTFEAKKVILVEKQGFSRDFWRQILDFSDDRGRELCTTPQYNRHWHARI